MTAFLLALAQLLAPAATPHITMAASSSVTAAAPAVPGSTVKLYVDVIPDRKIHVYAPGAKDYLPVVVELAAAAGVRAGKLTYPPSQDWYFEPLQEHVPVYQAPFRLTQDVAVSKTAKPGQMIVVTGVLKYQACDDTTCYNPVTAPVSWTVSVK